MAAGLRARVAALDSAVQRSGETPQGETPPSVASEQRQARQAAGTMQQAASQAQGGARDQARRSGEQAAQQLDPVSQQLLGRRDALRERWRRDVLATLDDALSETVDLAQHQMDLAGRMRRGEASPGLRGAQAALREGADRVLRRLQSAAGKNALVSPQVGATLGLSRLRMTEAIDQLQRAMPNTGAAADLAGQAVDGLNAMTQALLNSRAAVQGSQSGSGLQEAIEQMAKLAAQQQALNGQAGAMLPLVPLGGQGLMGDLRALAERQRPLAQPPRPLHAPGPRPRAGPPGPGRPQPGARAPGPLRRGPEPHGGGASWGRARRPSGPSALARRSAMRLAVSGPAGGASSTSCFAALTASGPPASRLSTTRPQASSCRARASSLPRSSIASSANTWRARAVSIHILTSGGCGRWLFLKEKPLNRDDSVKSRIENAVTEGRALLSGKRLAPATKFEHRL